MLIELDIGYTPVITALGNLRQEDVHFKTSLCYIAVPCLKMPRAGDRAQCYDCLPSTHKVLGSVLSRVRKEQWRLYRQYLLACLFFQDRVSPVVAYAFNISTQEAEACRFLSLSRLGVQSYTGKLLMFVNRGIMEHWGKNRLLKFARTVRHVAQMVLHLPDMHEFSSQYPVQSGVDHMSVIVVSGSRAE